MLARNALFVKINGSICSSQKKEQWQHQRHVRRVAIATLHSPQENILGQNSLDGSMDDLFGPGPEKEERWPRAQTNGWAQIWCSLGTVYQKAHHLEFQID